jgi:hypothetical protein
MLEPSSVDGKVGGICNGALLVGSALLLCSHCSVGSSEARPIDGGSDDHASSCGEVAETEFRFREVVGVLERSRG